MRVVVWSVTFAVGGREGEPVPVPERECHSGHSHAYAVLTLQSSVPARLTLRWRNPRARVVHQYTWVQPPAPTPLEVLAGVATHWFGPLPGECTFELDVEGEPAVSLPFYYRPWLQYNPTGKLHLPPPWPETELRL